MIPEREREALMRLTMCAREECGMCKYKEACDFDFQYETATRCMNILADALCKTENCSEIPNNCETCRFELYCPEMCEGCCEWDSHYEPKDEPTISKMEQVEDEPQTSGVVWTEDAIKDEPKSYSTWASTDKPQTAECPFDDPIPCEWVNCPNSTDCPYKQKTEPQTCSFSDCDNFKNPDYERCIECKRKQIKLKTEQTERSRR